MPKRKIAYEDLYKFQFVSDCQMSPDGKWILFTKTQFHADKKKDTYESHIWRVKASGGAPTQFTSSNESESNPRWSPDGKKILFLSSRDAEEERKGRGQIWVIPASGGEALKITDEKRGSANPKWSPDGKWILFFGQVPVDPAEDKLPKDKKSDVMKIRRLSYRWDTAGYCHDFFTHMFIVSAKGGKPRQLTSGEWDVDDAEWSTDGKTIFFSANPEEPDHSFARNVYSIPAAGGKMKKLCGLPGWISRFAPSPDGKTLCFCGNDLRKSFGTNENLYLVPIGGGELQNISRQWDLSIEQSVGGDSKIASPAFGPVWSPDGKKLKFLASHCGADHLFEFDVASKTAKQLTKGDYTIGALSYAKDQQSAAYTKMTPTELFEVWVWRNGEAKQLTRFNDALLSKLRLSTPKRFAFQASDKGVLEGWIMYPPGASKNKKLPAVLEIHGGPRTAYGMGFYHEFHLLNAAGFAVFYINPRGSSSYGEDFAFAVCKHYGERDYADIMEAVDYVVKNENVDPKNLGVTGGSYGGYMTNWIVGHTDRFKAACTQRSISNWIGFFGTSDIGWQFVQEEIGGTPWNNLELFWEKSPLKYAPNVKTPLLVIHSEEDWRCPIEQGEQLFTALKWMKKDVEFVRFPKESHELSRSGKPKHRIENQKLIIGWFERKILGKK